MNVSLPFFGEAVVFLRRDEFVGDTRKCLEMNAQTLPCDRVPDRRRKPRFPRAELAADVQAALRVFSERFGFLYFRAVFVVDREVVERQIGNTYGKTACYQSLVELARRFRRDLEILVVGSVEYGDFVIQSLRAIRLLW